MPHLEQQVQDFLAQRRIAVAGVSRTDKNAPGNLICEKLRRAGYETFPLNPHADSVGGHPCYRSLVALPASADALMVCTAPPITEQLVREAHAAGIRRVWMHRSVGAGSVSQPAVDFCRERQMDVIPGGCPMMFCQPVDFGHRCLRWFLRLTGGLPR